MVLGENAAASIGRWNIVEWHQQDAEIPDKL
jgi:hypothetical protein